VAHQPTLRPTKRSEAIFTQARAEFRQQTGDLEIHTQISVSPEDDVELTARTLANHGHSPRSSSSQVYASGAHGGRGGRRASGLQAICSCNGIFSASSALLGTRRAPRGGQDSGRGCWPAVGQGGEQGEVSCETDR